MASWLPEWLPGHAYVLTAVVIPTAFDGYTWRCSTAGTSGLVEPTWPSDPSLSPTVTDGGVVWTVGTGFRQAVQTEVTDLVRSFAAANPTIVRKAVTVRPRSLLSTELPVFWIGDLSETIETGQGTRRRLMAGFSCYLADRMAEPLESSDRMGFAVDVLTDLFTDGFHAVSARSILQHVGTNDVEFDENGVRFIGAEFLFGETFVLEGRT